MLLLSCWLAMGWLLNSRASASVELQCKEVQTIRTTGVGSGTSCSPSVIRRTVRTCLCNLWPPHCRHTSLWTARWQVVNCGQLDRCFMRCTCTTSPSAKRVFRAAPVSIATTCTYIASARQLRFIQAIRYSYTRFDFPWSQCLCVREDRECCSTDEPIEIPFARRLAWAPETIVLDGVHGHIGAIWRIRLIDTCGGDAGCR